MDLDEFQVEELSGLNSKPDRPVEPLHNAREPYIDYQREQARHRAVVEMKATGQWTNIQIAQQLNYTAVTVSNVLRQPWAQELLVKLMREQGNSEREIVYEMLEGLTIEAVNKQRDLLSLPIEGEEGCPEIVRKTSNDILNRVYGTPTQHLETHRGQDLDSLSDEELAKRLSELRRTGQRN